VLPGLDTVLAVGQRIARRQAQLIYGCCIYEWLKGRPGLTGTLNYMVVLKMLVIQAPNPSLYVPGLRFHRHHRRPQEGFIIADGIHRCHDGILLHDLAVPVEYGHFRFLVEGGTDLVFIGPGGLHGPPAVGIFHGVLHDTFYFIPGKIHKGGGGVAFRGTLVEKFLLQVLHMEGNRRFRVPLHARINGGIDLQAVEI